MKPDAQAPTARRQRTLTAAIGILALVALSVASFRSYRDLQLGRGREADLRRQIEESSERIEMLELRVERLREDPAMLETMAREELMMARPNEVVLVLPEESAVGSEPPVGEARD